jgi:hypothetical protein
MFRWKQQATSQQNPSSVHTGINLIILNIIHFPNSHLQKVSLSMKYPNKQNIHHALCTHSQPIIQCNLCILRKDCTVQDAHSAVYVTLKYFIRRRALQEVLNDHFR